jgi:3-oxoacyl-[acyl-carrier-protein] synthase II
MNVNCYIRGAACISPQQTGGDRLVCAEPDYTALIDPKALRRMSRIIRMGVATARACLQEAGIDVPDAIVTGTAYGCQEDTGLFLNSLIARNEEGLQPATFIQSTHNTVGAQIALVLQCTGYNTTFVHRGFSFESALLDAVLLLKEGEAATVLAGAADELTDTSYALLSRFGLFRHGLQAGEGAAFFLLSAEHNVGDWARLEMMETFYEPESIRAFPEGIDIDTIDLVIGEPVIPGKPCVPYRPLCGEYPTSTAFALWMAAGYIKNGTHRRILVYNDYLGVYRSFFIVSAI